MLRTAVFGALAVCSSAASAIVITDNYIGGADHGWGDVIGATNQFDITHADINRIGNVFTIDFYTNFAGRGDDGLFAAQTVGRKGIGYGDLFLSTAWSPFGSAPYGADNHANGTDWMFGFALDNRWSATGGNLTMYALTGTNAETALLAESFLSGGVYRNGQEVAVNTASAATSLLSNTGTWTVETDGVYDGNDRVRFVFDVTGTALASADALAFHWGLTCANDVIEGIAMFPGPQGGTIPEPGSAALMLIGLAPLMRRGRRSRRDR